MRNFASTPTMRPKTIQVMNAIRSPHSRFVAVPPAFDVTVNPNPRT
jgi:hypothetical protein